MVRKGQVIVNGFGNTQELLAMSLDNGIIRQLLDGIHGIIASDIDKDLNIQLIQYGKYFFIKCRILMDIRQLITAGTQECRRRPL